MVAREIEAPFVISWNGAEIKVTEHELKKRRVFYLEFPDTRKPMTMTVAQKDDGDKFWTSIPEGRQAEAELYGRLIANYIRTKRRDEACVITMGKKSADPSLFD